MNVRINDVNKIRVVGTKNLYFIDVFSKEGGRVDIVLNREQVEYLVDEIKQQDKIQNLLDSIANN